MHGRARTLLAATLTFTACAPGTQAGPAAAGAGRGREVVGADVGPQVTAPAFKVEALWLMAVNETGLGFLGSDEVVVVFIDRRGGQTSYFGFTDVDAGEVHEFAPDPLCVRPRAACQHGGVAGDVFFGVALWGLHCSTLFPCFIPYCDEVEVCYYDEEPELTADLIGRTEVTLPAARLLMELREVGDSVERVYPVPWPAGCDPEPHGYREPSGSGPSYRVAVRITRTEPVDLPVVAPPRDDRPRLPRAPPTRSRA